MIDSTVIPVLDESLSKDNLRSKPNSILSKVDTSEIDSMTHVGDIGNVTSHDKSQKTIQGSEFLDNCPETFGRFIKVPKILDKD